MSDEPPPQAGPLEAESHYVELRKFFTSLLRYVLLALTIIVGVGYYFFYKDIKEVRAEVERSTASLVAKAQDSLEHAMRDTENQLNLIRRDAANVAREEALARVEREFKRNEIQSLILTTKRRELGKSAHNLVNEEVEAILPIVQNEVDSVAGVIDMAIYARISHREGLNDLRRVIASSWSEKMRDVAETFERRICLDYDSVHTSDLRKGERSRGLILKWDLRIDSSASKASIRDHCCPTKKHAVVSKFFDI